MSDDRYRETMDETLESDEAMGAAEIANALAGWCESAGWHPAWVFAVRHCGFFITESNYQLFDEEDTEMWEDALDTWFEMHPDAPPLD